MSVILGVSLVGVSCLGAMWWLRQRHFRELPRIGDAEFAAQMSKAFGTDPIAVTVERKHIARVVGVPFEKLRPDTRFADVIAGRFDVSTRVGLGHLEDDFVELSDQARVPRQALPPSVGELIRERLALKSRIG
jgi:hypothetical protein